MQWCMDIGHERVLVTGGGAGIGRAVALALAELGVTVYVAGRRLAPLEETAALANGATGRVVPCTCDVRDLDAVDALFARIEQDGPATGLVNAAGEVGLGGVKEMPPAEFHSMIATSFGGAYNVIRRWGIGLIDQGLPGAAVAMTSATAVGGSPGLSHAAASKAGVVSLVRSLGREWGPYGVRINCVGPGWFPVPKKEEIAVIPAVRDLLVDMTPLRRPGAVPEIVAPTLFLLGTGSSYITGQQLVVDGGQTLQMWQMPEAMARRLHQKYDALVREDETS